MIRREDGEYVATRDESENKKYSNDPLNTLGDDYKKAKQLYDARERAEQKEELEKSLGIKLVESVKLVEEANSLNQKIKLPILVHVYYSENQEFDQKVDDLIECEDLFCELCENRLERQETLGRGANGKADKTAGTITLMLPLNNSRILFGEGYLFIVAEAIRLDPKKVDKNGVTLDYCALPPEKRKELYLKLSGEKIGKAVPLLDYEPKDNVIRIPIKIY